jgi:hypothetical protein
VQVQLPQLQEQRALLLPPLLVLQAAQLLALGPALAVSQQG